MTSPFAALGPDSIFVGILKDSPWFARLLCQKAE